MLARQNDQEGDAREKGQVMKKKIPEIKISELKRLSAANSEKIPSPVNDLEIVCVGLE